MLRVNQGWGEVPWLKFKVKSIIVQCSVIVTLLNKKINNNTRDAKIQRHTILVMIKFRCYNNIVFLI